MPPFLALRDVGHMRMRTSHALREVDYTRMRTSHPLRDMRKGSTLKS